MKTSEWTGERNFYQTTVDITLTFNVKVEADGKWIAKLNAREILEDLIANGKVTVDDGLIAGVNVEVDSEISEEDFFAAPGSFHVHLGSGSYYKLN